MKKSVLVSMFMLLMFWAGYSFAQCTPDAGLTDPDGDGQMAPDTLYGVENVPMNVTLTIIAPLTADVGGGTITLHHITIKSITNKPAWLLYACNPGNCEYTAGVNQCALVTGTPPAGSADTILMDVLVDVYMSLGGTPILAASDYNSGNQLVLIVSPPAAVEEFAQSGFGIIPSQPNPFAETTRIGCYTEQSDRVTLEVLDVLGNLIYSETMNTRTGENFFDFNGSALSSGIYFYNIVNEKNQKMTRKMVKGQ